MRITTRLAAGFGLMLLLLVGIAAFGYDRMTRMNEHLTGFYGDPLVKARHVADLSGLVNESGNSVNNILLRMQGSDDLAVQELNRQIAVYSERLKAFRAAAFRPDERQLADKVASDSGRYLDFLERFASLISRGQYEEARALQKNEGRLRQESAVHSLNALAAFEQGRMEEEQARAEALYAGSVRLAGGLALAGVVAGLGVFAWIFPRMTRGLNLLALMARKFGQGRLRGFARLEIKAKDELGELARLFRQIAMDLQVQKDRERLYAQAKEQQAWMDAQLARTTELLKDFSDANAVSHSFVNEFAPVLGASYGAVYLREENEAGKFVLAGSYANPEPERGTDERPPAFRPGEGLLGQCVLTGEPMTVEPLPPGYIRIRSGLGEADPVQLLLHPIKMNGQTIGAVELAYLQPAGNIQRELLDKLCEKFAFIVANIRSRQRVEELLRETQAMAEELQVQSEELRSRQEELRQTNEQLEGQREQLKLSEERLQRQQRELEHTSQELTVKTLELEEQNRQTERKSREVAKANEELERQARQLALASQYKSEFLANMSHELRTPLNSMIILAQFLEDNSEGNLTEKQLSFVRTIQSSGNDLLKMIDEILDLAKIDSGKMDIHPEPTLIEDITATLEDTYASIAAEKGLEFSIRMEENVPPVLLTDGHRLKQILRNLLSNALKFTLEGSIKLHIRQCTEAERENLGGREAEPYIAFAVEDTGIGIAPDKREVIFEAFRQADGTTSRKFGGTGLGLTISKELAALLGGFIELESEVGRGSTFTLYLPERCPDWKEAGSAAFLPESDSSTAGAAENGPPDRREAAEERAGASFPLPQAKPEAETAPEAQAATEAGTAPLADGTSKEPAGAEPADTGPAGDEERQGDSVLAGKTVLLVDDDERNVFSLKSLLEHHRLRVLSAENGREALAILDQAEEVDLVLMDIMMPEIDGYEAIARIRRHPKWSGLPIIALTAKAMKDDRDKCLQAGASDYMAKPVQVNRLLSLLKVWLSR